MILLPFRLKINFTRLPVLNWTVIAVTCVVFALQVTADQDGSFFDQFVLRDWDPAGMVGSLFLHSGFFHLAGNMLFLWVFGNAVCATVGNLSYPFLYLFLGVCASAVHLAFSGAPCIGASGAVNGVVGMSLVLFPVSELDCWYCFWFWYIKAGKITVQSFWMIGIWLLLDIVGLALGGDAVAHWAHIGGFVAGVMGGLLILLSNRLVTYDRTLVDVFMGRDDEKRERRDEKVEEQLSHALAPSSMPQEEERRMENVRKEKEEEIQRLWMQAGTSSNEGEEHDNPQVRVSRVSAATLRVLKTIRHPNGATCYFVNEGDELTHLQVQTEEGLTVAMHPEGVLKRKETGWIEIHGAVTDGLAVRVTYDDGNDGRGQLVLTVT